ncbi:hypothetical protein [Phaeobacter inhibens]|uniref:hypothetical protein n=1 Tax=Phaeobacter inhibens TaxID=221822 RepID=UPI000F4B57E3|nr:hypothetical protein [Phaeobacter inhibens]
MKTRFGQGGKNHTPSGRGNGTGQVFPTLIRCIKKELTKCATASQNVKFVGEIADESAIADAGPPQRTPSRAKNLQKDSAFSTPKMGKLAASRQFPTRGQRGAKGTISTSRQFLKPPAQVSLTIDAHPERQRAVKPLRA